MKSREIIIGRKIGMTQIFIKKRIMLPVTIIYIPNNNVVNIESKNNFYIAKILTLKKRYKRNIEFRNEKYISNNIKEIHIKKTNVKIGDKINVNAFKINEYIDVTGMSIGKGFCGVMKKYNFKGLEASHGVSRAHRSLGSTGQCQDPGKVFKGKKMPGQLGNKKKTISNIKIVEIDRELGIIVVHGSIPGYKGNFVYIKHSLKKYI